MSDELPVPMRQSALVPMSPGDALKFAEMIQNAEGMIPKAYLRQPGKILACVMAGQELGVGPLAALRAFHVVEGKPVADYSFWVARLKAAGYRVEFPVKGPEKVTIKLTAPDGKTSHTETWDKARAATAGLWNGKDNWKKYPENMLTARCVTSAGRAFAGEVMFGCFERDEEDEIVREAEASVREPEPQMTTARLAAAAGVDEATFTAQQEVQQRTERKARLVHDELRKQNKALADAVLAEFGAKGKRISELPEETLDKLGSKLGILLDGKTRDELLAQLNDVITTKGYDPQLVAGWAMEQVQDDQPLTMPLDKLARFVAWLSKPAEEA